MAVVVVVDYSRSSRKYMSIHIIRIIASGIFGRNVVLV